MWEQIFQLSKAHGLWLYLTLDVVVNNLVSRGQNPLKLLYIYSIMILNTISLCLTRQGPINMKRKAGEREREGWRDGMVTGREGGVLST
jgi:hypothetical protein